MSLTEAELAAIQARCDAATPGPWKLGYNRTSVLAPNGYFITEYDTADDGATEDAAFISAAREDVPKLLAALREARDLAFWVGMERDALRAEVARLKELRAHGCECGDDDACKFARERDEARAEVERLKALEANK